MLFDLFDQNLHVNKYTNYLGKVNFFGQAVSSRVLLTDGKVQNLFIILLYL